MLKIRPNINKVVRVIYVTLGLGLVITPSLVKLPAETSVTLPLLGAGAIASGVTGF